MLCGSELNSYINALTLIMLCCHADGGEGKGGDGRKGEENKGREGKERRTRGGREREGEGSMCVLPYFFFLSANEP